MNGPQVFLVVLLLALLWSCFELVRPYMDPILMAIIFAMIFHPLFTVLNQKWGHRPNLTAMVCGFILVFLVLIPVMTILIAGLDQGIKSYDAIQTWVASGKLENLIAGSWIDGLVDRLKVRFPLLAPLLPDIEARAITGYLLQFITTSGKWLISHASTVVGNMTGWVINFFLMIFVFFFVVRDLDKMLSFVLHTLPLRRSQEERMIQRIQDVSKSALLGTFATAAAQGAAGGFAFFLCGLPGLFWGTAMAFASLIPVVGTALIWLPGVLWLLVMKQTGWALFLAIWSVGVVGMIDNFVRPLFMQGSGEMSTVLIFFAIIGGVQMFGLIGVLYGPILFALTIALLGLYQMEFQAFLDAQDRL